MPVVSPPLIEVAAQWAQTTGPSAIARIDRLGGGTANEVAAVQLENGQRAIIKLAPEPAETLSYERHLLLTEELTLRTLGRASVPQPRMLLATTVDGGREAIVMSELPGRAATETGTAARPDRHELGQSLALLHRAGLCPRGPDRTPTPFDDPAIFSTLDAAASAFDGVQQPTLVHFDLWDGNLLVDDAGAITGVIDHERSLWADPTADLASIFLFADIPDAVRRDLEFSAGYRATAGRDIVPERDDAARIRCLLWGIYLAVIMVAEAAPRGYAGAWFVEHDARVRRWLDRLLTALFEG